MVTVKQVAGLVERFQKAQELVASAAVFPVAGLDSYSVVRNGDGTQMYLVRHEAGHEHCTCPDFQQRQQAAGMPCKHILAAQLAADAAAKPAKKAGKATEPAVSAAASAAGVTPEDLAILFGEDH